MFHDEQENDEQTPANGQSEKAKVQKAVKPGESFFIARTSKCQPGQIRVIREGYDYNYAEPLAREDAEKLAAQYAKTDPRRREYFVLAVVSRVYTPEPYVKRQTAEVPVILS